MAGEGMISLYMMRESPLLIIYESHPTKVDLVRYFVKYRWMLSCCGRHRCLYIAPDFGTHGSYTHVDLLYEGWDKRQLP